MVPALKTQAQIELKQLKVILMLSWIRLMPLQLLGIQKKVRNEIAGEVQRFRDLEAAKYSDALSRLVWYYSLEWSLIVFKGGEEGAEVQQGPEQTYATHRKFLMAVHYHAKEFKVISLIICATKLKIYAGIPRSTS